MRKSSDPGVRDIKVKTRAFSSCASVDRLDMGWDAWSGLRGGHDRFLATCLLSPPLRHAGSKAVVAGWKPAPRTLAYLYAQIGQCLFGNQCDHHFHVAHPPIL